MAAEGEKSTLDLLFAVALAETDAVLVNVGGTKLQQARIDILRTILSASDQVFSGLVTALKFSGDGALLTNLLFTGVGGTSSVGSLSLVCNSGGANPSAEIVWFKDGLLLGSFDENGFSPATGIPYSHADDAIPFAKNTDHGGFELLDSKTIAERQDKGLHFDGDSQNVTFPDDPDINVGIDDFTIVFWARMLDTPSSDKEFYAKLTGGIGFFIRQDDDGKLHWRIDDGTTDNNIESNDSQSNKVIGVCLRGDRDGLMTMNILGKPQTETATCPPLTLTNANDLIIGADSAKANFHMLEFYKTLIWNRLLTDDEEIEWASNPKKQLLFKDIGGSQVERISDVNDRTFNTNQADTGNDATDRATFESNYMWDLTGGNQTDISVASNVLTFTDVTSGVLRYDTGISFIPGKQYRIVIPNISALTGGFFLRAGANSSPNNVGALAVGLNEFDFIAGPAGDSFIHILTTSSGTISIDCSSAEITNKKLGCIAEYRPDTISSDKWHDAQNGNDGVVDADVINDFSTRDGPFTPAADFSGGNGTLSYASGYQVGTFKRENGIMHLFGAIKFDKGTASGDFRISGLPKANKNTANLNVSVAVTPSKIGAAGKVVSARITPNLTRMSVLLVDQGTAAILDVNATDISATDAVLEFQATYPIE